MTTQIKRHIAVPLAMQSGHFSGSFGEENRRNPFNYHRILKALLLVKHAAFLAQMTNRRVKIIPLSTRYDNMRRLNQSNKTC